jgi:trehalose/maltose transport system substrate-binding protein
MKEIKLLFCGCLIMLLGVCAYAKKDKMTITIAVGSLGKEYKVTKIQAEGFMKLHPDVRVNVVQIPSSTDEKLAYYLQQIEAKSSETDVFSIDIAWIGDIQKNLVDLKKYGVDKIVDKMFPIGAAAGNIDGRLVAAPWFSDTALLYYRTDMLKKYNLKVPKTWMELTKAAYTIQKGEREAGNRDFVGYVWQGNAYEGLTCNALEWIASNNGGTIVDNDKKVTLNNPNALNAIRMAKNWIGTISPKGVLAMDEEKSRAVFQSGNAAFMRNWPYAYVLGNQKGSTIKGKFDVSILPKGENGESKNCLGGWYLAINKYSKNPEMAAEFIKFIDNADMQKLRLDVAGQSPTIMSVYDDELLKKQPQYKYIFEGLKNAVARPSTVTAPYYNEVSKVFYKAVYEALNGSKDVDSAIAEAAKQISKITNFPLSK